MTEPSPPSGSGRPDEAVLEELASAFGADESAEEPAPEEPAEEEPAPEEPAEEEPAPEEPAEEEPAPEEPAEEEPTTDDVAELGGGMVGEPTVARRTIKISESDQLPDVSYLDEELAREPEEDDSSNVVFIDDDGSGDTIAPKEATQVGIEPRLRQRRIGVRRAAGRRRLKWVLLIGLVLAVVIAGLAVLGSSMFAIKSVSVSGAVYTDSVVLQEVIDDLDGSPVLTADEGAAEDRLEAVPWVESARVRTVFPNRATIEIRERTPLITMRGVDGKFRVLDREGRVLDSIEGQPVAMVLLAGQGTLDVEPGDFAPIGPTSAAALVKKLTPAIRSRVDHLLVTSDGSDLRVILTNGDNPLIEVEFGSALGDNEQIEKLVRLERILEDVGNDPVTVINVSTSEVTVR